MPSEEDYFEFALSHAMENLRRYRIGRKKQFQVDEAHWSTIVSAISSMYVVD